MPRSFLSVALSLLLVATVSAQTFVVDAANGPGTQFTNLDVAVNSVPDGAILLVRPGSYGGVEVNAKGLSILATGPGVVIEGPDLPLFVHDLAATQSFTFRGFAVTNPSLSDITLFRNCAGPVLIDDFTFDNAAAPPGFFFTSGIRLEHCAQVMVRDSNVRAFAAIDAVSSDLVCENCQLLGEDAVFRNGIGAYAGVGVQIDHGSLSMSRCQVRGGNGLILPFAVSPAEAALVVASTTVRLAEDLTGSYLAGQLSGGPPVAAIVGNAASTLVRDPSATVLGSNGGPPVSATLPDTVRALPSLQTIDAPPGGVLQGNVTTPIGTLVLVIASLPGSPSTLPFVDGELWLDPATALLLTLGVPQPGVPVQHSIAVPNVPALLGARFVWQALAFDPLSGLSASIPSLYAH